jgi:hypothetical protein
MRRWQRRAPAGDDDAVADVDACAGVRAFVVRDVVEHAFVRRECVANGSAAGGRRILG